MYTGWWKKFPVDRKLTQRERDEALPRQRQPGVVPNQRMGLIRINSTYIDWIDRRFRLRGMVNSSIIFLGFLIFFVLIFLDIGFFVSVKDPLALMPMTAILLSLCLLYYGALRYEFFTYVYYPIRFNRKTRKVHVFRHNGPDGTLTLPWEDVYFHIGYGASSRYLTDIRGEVMDGDIVRDTFAVGHCGERIQEVYDSWEFIVRYMEEGPQAVADDPLDKYVELSVSTNWDNCLLFAIWNCDAQTAATRITRAPLIYLYASTRWLIFKTCKQPQFPREITVSVDPDDPNVWPIPEHTAQFVTTVPGLLERSRERLRQSRDPNAEESGWPDGR